jgi:hypothetical protein
VQVSLIQRLVDERFLTHRLRSSSIAGIVTAAAALIVFEYRLLAHEVWSWDLLAVGLTFVALKLGLMTYYYLTN